ncbi:MAG: hypothetical protein P8Q14_09670 [Vicingaceae bacterium]|nr:hypothetical protein [Vicingaceae bacterium]
MKNIFQLSAFIFLTLFTASCGNETVDKIESETPIIEEPFIDDSNAEETAADTSSNGVYQEEVTEEEISLQDAIKNNAETPIEAEGISFCDCVKKNKKLTDIMMADETSDADFDNAMAELEKMKTGECKIMFPNQSNIEEQQAHQRKVKNCLN